MSEYEQVIDEIVKHGVVVKVNKIVDDNYIPYERKYVGCVVELNFSEHDKVFEDKIAKLEKENKALNSYLVQREQDSTDMIMKLNQEKLDKNEKIAELTCKNQSLKQRIAELESKKTETCENEPKISDSAPSREWYENRHQSDCIEINRLNTTIDVLIHKVEYLRQFAGLE